MSCRVSTTVLVAATLVLLTGSVALSAPPAADAVIKAVPALAMHGDPKYGADFKHLDYANPDAPKGGTLRMAATGTFDSLNPYIIKGVPAPGIGMVYQTLLTESSDEPFSEYGLIAQSIEMPEDRSWVVFNLRPEATWNDGKPVTAEDVVFSFDTLTHQGHPFYRSYYAHVKSAVAENAHRVKFTFDMKDNRELPLIIGQLPVLPKHFWAGKAFDTTSLTPPLGSGPYRVKAVDPGRRITYERVKDWWAKDLPIMKGQYNFDTIVFDIYRDDTVLLQGLFAGNYDFRQENVAKAWATGYDQKPVKEGLIRKEEIHHSLPAGMQAFAYNTRRKIFQDPKVRAALNYAFDFEWSDKQFAYGTYKRTKSYFANSDLAASGTPSGRELEILQQFKGQVPDEVFTKEYDNPHTSGSGEDLRDNLTAAKKMLGDAGWKIAAGGLLMKDGQPFTFEILVQSEVFERWVNPFIANLKRLGITAKLRVVDDSQYQNRMDNFDFDMTVTTFGESMSPGNEQRDYWGSEKADVVGSRNIIGIKNPVIDEIIKLIVTAKDEDELQAATHALDRVLLWNYYVIPQWYTDYYRVAYWDKFDRPDTTPKYDLGVVNTWWYDTEKAAKIAEKINPSAK